MSCKEIIIAKLKELGADGLCCYDCGCSIDNLFHCEGYQFYEIPNCEPAKKIKNPDCYDKAEIFVPLNKQTKVISQDDKTTVSCISILNAVLL